MGHQHRFYVANEVHEVTIRTEQGTFFLRPDAECRARVEGVLGKALQRYAGVRVHAYDVQSNHLHLPHCFSTSSTGTSPGR